MSARWLAALAALTVVFVAAPRASAEARPAPSGSEPDTSGHASVLVGARIGEEGTDTRAWPLLRVAMAFDVADPLAIGGFVEVLFSDADLETPGVGGGLVATLRPPVPLLGFVPHLELTAARQQLPSRGQVPLVDAWSAGLGAGVGARLGSLFVLEARVHHVWYFGLPAHTELDDRAWTAALALTVDLP